MAATDHPLAKNKSFCWEDFKGEGLIIRKELRGRETSPPGRSTRQEEAIAACREVNRGLNSKDPACCVVVDGPEDNCAVVDLETAKDLLDFEESQLPCLIVTD